VLAPNPPTAHAGWFPAGSPLRFQSVLRSLYSPTPARERSHPAGAVAQSLRQRVESESIRTSSGRPQAARGRSAGIATCARCAGRWHCPQLVDCRHRLGERPAPIAYAGVASLWSKSPAGRTRLAGLPFLFREGILAPRQEVDQGDVDREQGQRGPGIGDKVNCHRFANDHCPARGQNCEPARNIPRSDLFRFISLSWPRVRQPKEAFRPSPRWHR